MHLHITSKKYKGKEIKHAKIVESYRDLNKVSRKRTILNLGPVKTQSDLIKYNKILSSMKQKREFIEINQLSIDTPKEFGVTYTFKSLLIKYGINDVLHKYITMNRCKFDAHEILMALLIHQTLNPSSDLSAADWINKYYNKTLCVTEDHLYRTLDYLIAHKDEIEIESFECLKSKLNLDTSQSYYDLTSSYFEGKCCPIALFGHTRDHRPDRKQVVIGVVMCDGIPVFHEVHKGNTADKTTLKSMQENLKNKLKIKQTIFFADAGLMTNSNISAIEIEEYNYVLGCYRRGTLLSEKLLEEDIVTLEKQKAKEVHKEKVMINKKLLFTTSSNSIIKAIKDNVVSKELLKLFEEQNKLLSNKLSIGLKGELAGTKKKNEWRLINEENKCSYSIEKHRDNKKKQIILEVYLEKPTMKRYILYMDKNTKKERLETLKQIKNKLELKLKELAERFTISQKSKGKNKMSIESLIIKTNKALGKSKRLFNISFDKGLIYSVNEKSFEYEKKIAGKFLLVTNTDIDPDKAMKEYKRLQTVENAFDDLKNKLNMRPIFHRKTRRVKAHIFVSYLSFQAKCIIERFTSETANKVINELRTISVMELKSKTLTKKIISNISDHAKYIFGELKILLPTKFQE